MKKIIPVDKSIIPACDVDSLERLRELVCATHDIPGVGAYKVGFTLALRFGLPAVVKAVRQIAEKPIIYDHQKAATDIPDTGAGFANACASAGVDAVILFPLTGPATQSAWIRACRDAGLGVLVGAEMTHEKFLHSQGGYVADDAPSRAYALAASEGVTDFVVPGNKPQKIRQYRSELESIVGSDSLAFYSPGFVAQGGSVGEGAKAAGRRFHAFVGRGIYGAGDGTRMRQEALALTAKLEK